jgi:hypothetical protein
MMEMHSNDTAREGKPGIWIFHGRAVAALVIGVAITVSLFRILSAFDIDLLVIVVISVFPFLVIALVVWLMRGKPSSYAEDMLLLFLWRARFRLYTLGALDHPPELWIKGKHPTHPKEF